jgi:predicted nicotinamide N-methyase
MITAWLVAYQCAPTRAAALQQVSLPVRPTGGSHRHEECQWLHSDFHLPNKVDDMDEVTTPSAMIPANFWILCDGSDAPLEADIESCRAILSAHRAGEADALESNLVNLSQRPVAVELAAPSNVRRFRSPSGAVELRELSFGEGGLGHSIWDAGIALGVWLQHNREYIESRGVLELGSGTGLAGICAHLAGADSVTLTDTLDRDSSILLDNLHSNAERNLGSNYCVEALDWSDCMADDFSPRHRRLYDRVIGSDLVYYEHTAPMLAAAVIKHLAPGGLACLMNVKGRTGVDAFNERMCATREGQVTIRELTLVNNFGTTPLVLTEFRKYGDGPADTVSPIQ